MKRKTHVLVVSATNAVKKRARAGFRFTADPRAVMVTLDRKLALAADSDLKVYRPKSDHYLRATGKEEMPDSIAKRMDDGLRKLHTTVIAEVDYQRSEDSIRNEMDMIGEEGVEQVAKDLGIKAKKDEDLTELVVSALLQLEAEPVEVDPADDEPEEEDEDEETDDEDEEGDEETDELDEEAVLARFDELDSMTPEDLAKELEKHGYEDEGEKDGKILAILTEEFGEGVEDVELPEITADGEGDDDDAGDEETDDGEEEEGDEGEEEASTAVKRQKQAPSASAPAKGGNTPKPKKNAPTAKKKAPAKGAKKK